MGILRTTLKNAEKELVDVLARQTKNLADIKLAKTDIDKANIQKLIAQDTKDVAIKQAARDAAKNSLDAARNISKRDLKLTKSESKAASEADSKSWISQNAGKVVGGIGAAALAASALIKYAKSSDTPRTITKVEDGGDGNIKITFTPAIEILETDLIDIKDSKTTALIDGSGIDVISDESESQIIIKPTNPVTQFIAGGIIDVHTSFIGQVGAVVADAGGELVDGAKNFLCGFLPFMCGFSTTALWIILAIILCACFASSYLAATAKK